MISNVTTSSITGAAFDDVLNELHAHAFTGVPGESRPFTLSVLEREYVAYILSCYYKCEHCIEYHSKQIERELVRTPKRESATRSEEVAEPAPQARLNNWPWRKKLDNALLYLRIEKAEVSDDEWSRWEHNWREYASMVRDKHDFCLSVVAYAVSIARDDEPLMNFIFPHLSQRYSSNETLDGVISDIVRVVVFMKAATTKNRVMRHIKRHLVSRGIE